MAKIKQLRGWADLHMCLSVFKNNVFLTTLFDDE